MRRLAALFRLGFFWRWPECADYCRRRWRESKRKVRKSLRLPIASLPCRSETDAPVDSAGGPFPTRTGTAFRKFRATLCRCKPEATIAGHRPNTGRSDRRARRIVAGKERHSVTTSGEGTYHTADHHRTFRRFRKSNAALKPAPGSTPKGRIFKLAPRRPRKACWRLRTNSK